MIRSDDPIQICRRRNFDQLDDWCCKLVTLGETEERFDNEWLRSCITLMPMQVSGERSPFNRVIIFY